MSLFNITNEKSSSWNKTEKILLRFFFIFFLVQIIPLDWQFYRDLLSIGNGFNFYYFFRLSRYYPEFIGIQGFINLAVAAIIALAGSLFWIYRSARHINDDILYYWLRVILRYRLAVGVIAYGLIKLFPLQMPFPSLSNLHTNYGDFYAWKIYFHTLGISQGYEIFLGAVEVTAGILLLFRKTTTFGAGIILGFTGNVFAANLAYDVGEQVYSAYLLFIAVFLFAYDAPKLFRLIVQGKYTRANRFKPLFDEKYVLYSRRILKSAVVIFVLLLSITTYSNYISGPYKYPATPGLKDTYGFYNVREFKLNNKTISYSPTDPDRWQNVVFEKWATLSIKTAKPVQMDQSNGDVYTTSDMERNFESTGVGGRRYYGYSVDSVKHTLQLQNKNRYYTNEKYTLNYSFVNDSTIILQGTNEKNDSVYAVLDKITKKYLFQEGRRKRVKL